MSASPVQNTKLGASGLSISPLIVGCMTFGKKKWADWVIEDEEKVFSILKKCYDSGLRTFDTADVYSNGHSEILLGKFLKKYNIPREKVVIMTKVFGTIDTSYEDFTFFTEMEKPAFEFANNKGLSRKHVLDAVKGSVERLGTFIDVLQIHRLDKETPKAEIMKSLNDVVVSGDVRYIGASSMKASEFCELQYIADKNGWTKFISMQNFYNLLYREEEREMIPFCKNNDLAEVGIIPWSPIATGILARPLGAKSAKSTRADTDWAKQFTGLDKLTEADETIVNRVEEIAKKHDTSMASVASAWVLSKGAHPILGINSVERVDDALKSLTFKLTAEETAYLEEPYKPKKVYGLFD
ncbi:aryl-alcohol dehydrogenase [Scheffersomyces stipitis CBS 6054]|uniref:Aryl-alcohol dehydrogenase n=1 Tax=Scheffersomyces stipitis (strain ATCC 58785 / CBS 6054 / NBRC 10063 / NRRL Y-11545) TaxID=322104 RepID=A3LW44_PICST|nr:aryl-alcohol dehydrogenase [Scheffersomyces stipitis CBS 6054]ABN66901.1 aryl-alcohol dehydrogenase [Scheffersomyces stipitis CBS 6054]